MTGYRHLTKEDRIKIEALLKAKINKTEIARQIGCNRSTINREVKRGLYMRNVDWNFMLCYSADIGQKVHDEKAAAKGVPLKVGNDWDFVNYVEDKIINKKYSPDAVIGRIKREGLNFKGMVCTRTLYSYIYSGDIFPNLTKESLLMKGKRIRNYDKVKRLRVKKPLQKSIEDRPREIECRANFGDWEMDTVKGTKNADTPTLLVLTERMTRMEIIRKMPDGTQKSVISVLDELERNYGSLFSKVFCSITVDNGSEFLNDIGLERSINGGKRTTVYFCHPYSSYERGSNENANKLIRRFIPKGMAIGGYSDEYVRDTQDWMNSYPRRLLDYYTPLELFNMEMERIIAS